MTIDTQIYEPREPEPPKIVILKGTIQKETAKAILINNITQINGFEAEDVVAHVRSLNCGQWFPLSRTHKIVRSQYNGEDELHVEKWLCEQKGLVEYESK